MEVQASLKGPHGQPAGRLMKLWAASLLLAFPPRRAVLQAMWLSQWRPQWEPEPVGRDSQGWDSFFQQPSRPSFSPSTFERQNVNQVRQSEGKEKSLLRKEVRREFDAKATLEQAAKETRGRRTFRDKRKGKHVRKGRSNDENHRQHGDESVPEPLAGERSTN